MGRERSGAVRSGDAGVKPAGVQWWDRWVAPFAADLEAAVIVSGRQRQAGGWKVFARVSTSSGFTSLSAQEERAIDRASDVYVSAALLSIDLLSPRAKATDERGGAGDVVALPGLWLDVDCADGLHKVAAGKRPLPSRTEALEVVSTISSILSVEPMTVDSGGGYHIWYPLSELVTERSEIVSMLAAWKTWAVAHFANAGFHLDPSVFEPARVLRLPGYTNNKSVPRPVKLLTAGRGSLEATLVRELASSSRPSPSRPVANLDETLPGNRLSAEVPVHAVLLAWGWNPLGDPEGDSCQWTVPSSGSSSPSAATSYRGDETSGDRVTVFSSTLADELKLGAKLDSDETQTSYVGSYRVLGAFACKGDWKLATRLAGRAMEDRDPTTRLAGMLEAARQDPSRDPTELLAELAAPLPGEQGAQEVIHLSPDGRLYAVMSGTELGFWELTQKGDDEPRVPTRITDFVAWVAEEVYPVVLDSTGEAVPATSASAILTVRVKTQDSRTGETECAPEDIDRPTQVLRRTIRGLSLPEAAIQRAKLGNAIDQLGYKGQLTETKTRVASQGWQRTDRGPVFLAAAGSVSSEGVDTNAAEVAEPSGYIDPTFARIGWPDAPSPSDLTDTDWLAVTDWLALLPSRPEVSAALLGAIFASPLRLSLARPSVLLTAPPGVGKSVLLRCAGLWQAESSPLLNLPGASEAGVRAWLRWARDSLVLADDFRAPPGRQAAERAEAVLEVLAQAAYDGSQAARARQDGSRRGGDLVSPSLVMTGELSPNSAAITQRLLVIRLDSGDVPLSDGSPIDKWKLERAPSARRLFGSYLRWIASQHKTPSAITDHWDGKRLEMYHRFGDSRVGEQLAALGCGLDALRSFAAASGREGIVPPLGRLGKTLHSLGTSAHAAADVVEAALMMISEMLDGGNGHLLAPGEQGEWAAGAFRRTGSDSATKEPQGVRFGWALKEGVWVPPAAIRAALGRLGRDGELSAARIGFSARFGALRRSPAAVLGSRPEGWLVPYTNLGMDGPPKTHRIMSYTDL